jgi:Polyketide cyclase / dehydrase and lipid transport
VDYSPGVPTEVSERIVVRATPDAAYHAVADVRHMARLSPECFGVWVYRRRDGHPDRFVGFNRRKLYVWFTTCRVVTAEPGHEFVFDVTTFGQPVSRWGYRFAALGGGTEVTEYWQDMRSRSAYRLGRIFTGRVADARPEHNRAGMRTTLERLQADLAR